MTLATRVIPCLDVDEGRVVKGVRFEGLRDMGDPAELAARYAREGADEIVFLDITATAKGRAAAGLKSNCLSVPTTSSIGDLISVARFSRA